MGYRRYVALGDSTTEGLEDPYPDGRGYRGWADRLAERLAQDEPELGYANLAVRGRLAGQVREEQLEAALALEPDLASVLAGLNDALRRSCDVGALAGHLEAMTAALRGAGADVLLFTFPDPAPRIPLAGTARDRLFALNASLREIAARHGARLADLEPHAIATDPRLWHPDRLHANADGHARIAAAAAQALGLRGADDAWTSLLPPGASIARHRALATDALWLGRHVAPWVMRRVRGRSSGDGRVPKRPTLERVV